MIKKFALILAITFMTSYAANISFAADTKKRTVSVSPAVYSAVSKYKQKNYTGCIQELLPIIEKNENNALAHYYLGISYAQLGIKDEAQKAYQKVVDLDSDAKLVEYSKRAIACLNDQPQCSPNYSEKQGEIDEMTVFIQSGKFLHDDVKRQVQEKSLDKVKDNINNNALPQSQDYKYINDASGQVNVQPTDAEIANAVKVLAKVGFNPYSVNALNAQYVNPQLAQLSAIMGNTNLSSNNNMASYLPYLLSQGSNQNPEMTKQMMQTMMMSQMLPEFGFSSNNASGGSF